MATEETIREKLEDAMATAVESGWNEAQIREEFEYNLQNFKDEGELKDDDA